MFSYIRWFSAISFILVTLAAILVGHYFKEIASHDLIDVVERNNASLAQGFINTTWNMHCERPVSGDQSKSACSEQMQSGSQEMQAGADWYRKFRDSHVKVEDWKNYRGYQDMVDALDTFSRSVFKHFEDMPIVEVRVYAPDGTQLISTDQSRFQAAQSGGSLLSAHPPQAVLEDGTFAKAMSGKIATGVLEDQPFVRPDGGPTRGVIIKTLIPVTKDNYVPVVVGKAEPIPVQAVLEIRCDVTKQWKSLELFKGIGTGGVISIFLVVIMTLLFTANKAETIIAKQHETNIELAAQAASAQAENRDKSQFLANISHELRTPLNAIIGFSEFIKSERSGPIGSEKYAEYIRDIHSSGVHLLSLINDILDYSKAEADKLELEISEVDATKSVMNCVRLVSPRAESGQVQLVEAIPREHFVLKTDAKKLKQILLNLLSNAVKFTPAGGSVTITMWQNVVNGALSIEVKDTGIGIAPKDISRAMAPFGQVDNTLSRKYEGTGLGLPLTRKFTEIMGGTFQIESEVGKGTTTTITLPKETPGKAVPAQNTD